MNVYLQDNTELLGMATSSNNDHLFNLAVNEVTTALLYAASKVGVSYTWYVSVAANGQFCESGQYYTYQSVGSNIPIKSVAPAYFPVATAGAECAAVLSTSLSWADNNLLTGYDSILMNPQAQPTAQRWFVTGILNSSQTEANDPFGSTATPQPDFVDGCCWAGNYVSGVNPFA